MFHPQIYFSIRPTRFDALLDYYGAGQRVAGFVSWQRYSILLELADILKEKLSVYGVSNAIEIQSYMWVVSYYLLDKIKEAPTLVALNFEAELKSRVKRAKEKERIGLLGEKFVYEQEILNCKGNNRLTVVVVHFSSLPLNHRLPNHPII